MRVHKLQKFTILLLAMLLVLSAVFVSMDFSSIAYASTENNTIWGSKDISTEYYYDSNNFNLKEMMKVQIDTSKLNKASPVRIAVIDTGLIDVDENPKLQQLYDGLIPIKEYIDDGLVYQDWLAYNSTKSKNQYGKAAVMDERDYFNTKEGTLHGTSVTTIIAMQIKAMGLQDYIKIVPIKANSLGTNQFTNNSINNAIQYAVSDDVKADIINLSLGSYDNKWANDTVLRNTIKLASEKAIIVAAAGNNGNVYDKYAKANTPFYPAAYDNVVSVMASDDKNTLRMKNNMYASNFGYYDVIAPGESIYTYTASQGKDSKTTVEGWGYVSGTSMAAPLVSAYAAIYRTKLKTLFKADQMPTPNVIAETIINANFSGIEPIKIEVKGLYKGPDNTYTDFKKPYVFNKIDTVGLLQKNDYSDGFVYQNPTDISLECVEKPNEFLKTVDGEMEVFTGLFTPEAKFKFRAKLEPIDLVHPSKNARIQWYIQYAQGGEGKIIQYGPNLDFVPEMGGEGNILTATYYDGEIAFSKSVKINLTYLPFNKEDCKVTLIDNIDKPFDKVPSDITVSQYKKYTLGITGLKFVDKSKLEVKWLVNGKVVGSGFTYDYEPTKHGVDKIAVLIKNNGNNDKEYTDIPGYITVHVESFAKEPIAIMSFVIVGGMVITGIILLIVIIERKQKAKRFKD